MPPMAAVQESRLEQLSRNELEALLDSAVWYAKYHAHIITERADDRSAAAESQRERYRDLHSALWKLGVKIRRPAGLDAAA
jgi:hypothetical protein